MYEDHGVVRLSVVSHAGKEAVIAVLEAGHFFGDGCLASQPRRMATRNGDGATHDHCRRHELNQRKRRSVILQSTRSGRGLTTPSLAPP
jgi:hypothetical protein